jgi:hypothetical protein
MLLVSAQDNPIGSADFAILLSLNAVQLPIVNIKTQLHIAINFQI